MSLQRGTYVKNVSIKPKDGKVTLRVNEANVLIFEKLEGVNSYQIWLGLPKGSYRLKGFEHTDEGKKAAQKELEEILEKLRNGDEIDANP